MPLKSINFEVFVHIVKIVKGSLHFFISMSLFMSFQSSYNLINILFFFLFFRFFFFWFFFKKKIFLQVKNTQWRSIILDTEDSPKNWGLKHLVIAQFFDNSTAIKMINIYIQAAYLFILVIRELILIANAGWFLARGVFSRVVTVSMVTFKCAAAAPRITSQLSQFIWMGFLLHYNKHSIIIFGIRITCLQQFV